MNPIPVPEKTLEVPPSSDPQKGAAADRVTMEWIKEAVRKSIAPLPDDDDPEDDPPVGQEATPAADSGDELDTTLNENQAVNDVSEFCLQWQNDVTYDCWGLRPKTPGASHANPRWGSASDPAGRSAPRPPF